jgi:hypothetical protein
MKSIVSIAISFLFYINVSAQETVTTTTLLPDQNPNYQKSRDKYMAESVTLTKTEGTTIQQTYKAIDDVQAKKERKELAIEHRHERRMARIQSRSYRRQAYYNNGWRNNGFFDNGYYNNGYYNNGYYNNGFYSNPPSWHRPYYYQNNLFGSVNSTLNTALLGLTLWSILKH